MAALTRFHQRWEVRLTLRLTSFPDQAVLDSIADMLRQHPNVVLAHVGIEIGTHSEGITATIVLTQPSTPGVAVDEATNLLVAACAAAGLMTDIIKEVVAEMADVDPRTL